MAGYSDALQIGNALDQTRQAPDLKNPHSMRKARETAENFEAFFLSQMLQPMFANIEASEPFGGGPSEKIWQSMMVDEYGKNIARSGGIGIADQVMQEILKLQEMK